ncbi:uncharacterized protein LOC129598306 [Paramacrobiotus metropolitanus]|uniref:uncharacterized protein LOC129598306 n=1 Tax=Paramacrobiotus metropolitanus TaxID=2943436 RepID=UPI002445BDDE|nr:uncharacterized protein LOC129598306 [Paramacrobiotus metropolitanus]
MHAPAVRRLASVWLCCAGWIGMLRQAQLCAGCPNRPPSTSDRSTARATTLSPVNSPDLNDMVSEALKHHLQDDRIILTRLAVSEAVRDSVVSRPRLGENVTFRCVVPAGSDGRDVLWLHQDRTVYEADQAVPLPADDVSGQEYQFTRSHDTLFLTVLKVTLRSGGSVQCAAAPSGPAYTPDRRVLQRYMLLPLVTRRTDVFAPPNATHLTAAPGQSVTLTLDLRLPLPDAILHNILNHVLWRHKGRLLHGPTEPPYGPLLPGEGLAHASPRGERHRQPPDNRPGMLHPITFTFASVTPEHAGYVECFLRPHPAVHEWILQTTELFIADDATHTRTTHAR